MATLIGVAGVLLTYWNIQQDRASESWPEAPGEVLKARIESKTTRTTTSTGTGLNKKKKTHKDTDYFVELRYAYKVEGQAYEGDRIRFASTRHDERADEVRGDVDRPEQTGDRVRVVEVVADRR